MITTMWATVLGEWSQGHMMDGPDGWHWAWMWLGFLVVFALVALAAWLGARAGSQGPRPTGRSRP